MTDTLQPPVPAMPAPPRIVGLGASAGGLEPLEQFFANVPPDTGMAWVVVQHMDPTHKALLTELLQRVTAMRVTEATDGMPLRADSVYVIPPGGELTVGQGRLHLDPPAQPRGRSLPIDVLFMSLARDQGSRAVGVVLSGMGADGTAGLEAIHAHGGLCLCQRPDSAQFDAMPLNAMASKVVDAIDLPGQLPAHILAHAALSPVCPEPGHDAASGAPSAQEGHLPEAQQAESDTLTRILDMLRVHSKHDLSLYKTSTLLRRIERRVAVHRLDSMQAYADSLVNNPQELDLLFAEMLIGVTSFFRDAAVWTQLKDTVLPGLLSLREDVHRLRAWVVGCSTGEEAYSLAMVMREALDARPDASRWVMQVFASDLSAQSIVVARKGLYPKAVSADVGPERLARFFTPQANGWLVGRDIREMVLFAQHDVLLDPPFTHLDLISCRNVLIYFNPALQHRLLPMFHYSLEPGGVLLLGSSETIGRAQHLFKLMDPKTRWHQRLEQAVGGRPVDHPGQPAAGRARPGGHAALSVGGASAPEALRSSSPLAPQPNLQALADRIVLQQHSPAAVLVNAAGDILYTNGRTGRYLEPAAGKANWNIHAMAKPNLGTQLAIALRKTLRDGLPADIHGLRLEEGATTTLHVTAQLLKEPAALRGHVMVVFREVPSPPSRRPKVAAPKDVAHEELLEELEHSREEIRLLRQDMQTSSDEVQAVNEAMQSANEDLQSTNEELTTSKEETQSMNEELQTLVGELQSKLDDLALAQSDMQNLLDSTHIATLFLDSDLNVRRFTEQAANIFHLRDSDVGRPLTDLASILDYPTIQQDARAAVESQSYCEREIAARDGRWFSVRVMPYRTLTKVVQGVVLTLVDITVAKELESKLRKA